MNKKDALSNFHTETLRMSYICHAIFESGILQIFLEIFSRCRVQKKYSGPVCSQIKGEFRHSLLKKKNAVSNCHTETQYIIY